MEDQVAGSILLPFLCNSYLKSSPYLLCSLNKVHRSVALVICATIIFGYDKYGIGKNIGSLIEEKSLYDSHFVTLNSYHSREFFFFFLIAIKTWKLLWNTVDIMQD